AGRDRMLFAALLPFFVLVLALGFGDRRHLPDWGDPLRRVYIKTVDARLPTMSPELADLLERAGVGATDPICYVDNSNLLNAMPVGPGATSGRGSQRAWLPTWPFPLSPPLPGDRGRVYLARFAERARLGGWLIEPNSPDGPAPSLGWFFEWVGRTHSPTSVFQ